MQGLVLVTVLHTFPFVYLLASSALQSVDASYEEAAQILGAGKLRTALSITAPLVAPAILSGTLLAFVNAHRAVRLAGDHRAARRASSRCRPASTRCSTIRPNTGSPPRCRSCSCSSPSVALYLQRGFLARRSYVTLAGKGSRPQLIELGAVALGAARLCRR